MRADAILEIVGPRLRAAEVTSLLGIEPTESGPSSDPLTDVDGTVLDVDPTLPGSWMLRTATHPAFIGLDDHPEHLLGLIVAVLPEFRSLLRFTNSEVELLIYFAAGTARQQKDEYRRAFNQRIKELGLPRLDIEFDEHFA